MNERIELLKKENAVSVYPILKKKTLPFFSMGNWRGGEVRKKEERKR
jgi:hypothetical protein